MAARIGTHDLRRASATETEQSPDVRGRTPLGRVEGLQDGLRGGQR